jgi:hypothetical protein
MKEEWNNRFGVPEYIYGKEPNEFFSGKLKEIKIPGRILLPSEGEGRNAVHAALAGWEVYAFDFSDVAISKALKLAEENNVKIFYDCLSIEEVILAKNRYDAVGLIFNHMNSSVREEFHNKVVKSLKPGGTLIFEAYSIDQLGRTSGGPKIADVLYNLKSIEEDFKSLDLEYIEQVDIDLSEGKLHQGKANVIRVLGHRR